MKRHRSHGTLVLKGLTPLLDTIFLLLFALLVSSKAKTASETELVHIELPEVQPSEDVSPVEGRRLVVMVDADSNVRLAGEEAAFTSREEIDAALAAALGDAVPEEVNVEIHADREARHGVTVEVLQYLRVRGFVRVQLVAVGESSETRNIFGDRR